MWATLSLWLHESLEQNKLARQQSIKNNCNAAFGLECVQTPYSWLLTLPTCKSNQFHLWGNVLTLFANPDWLQLDVWRKSEPPQGCHLARRSTPTSASCCHRVCVWQLGRLLAILDQSAPFFELPEMGRYLFWTTFKGDDIEKRGQVRLRSCGLIRQQKRRNRFGKASDSPTMSLLKITIFQCYFT